MTNTVARYEVLRRDSFQCQACGRKAPEVTLEVDHIRPVSLGGLDIPENLQALCRDCNRGKSATPPDSQMVEDVRDRNDEFVLARAEAAQIIANEQRRIDPVIEQFHVIWGRYTWDGEEADLHPQWEFTLRDFLMNGLREDDMFELVDTAANTCRGPATAWGRFYFLAQDRVNQINNLAHQIIGQKDRGRWMSSKHAED